MRSEAPFFHGRRRAYYQSATLARVRQVAFDASGPSQLRAALVGVPVISSRRGAGAPPSALKDVIVDRVGAIAHQGNGRTSCGVH